MRKKTIRSGSCRKNGVVNASSVHLSQWGFSLIEVLVTFVISSILLTLAFPVFNDLVLALRILILTERMNTTLDYAQNEAIRRQNVVTLCKSKEGQTCSGTWKDGWIVFAINSVTKNKVLLRAYPALSEGEFLEWHGFRSDDYLQMHPDGSVNQNGSFIVCIHSLSKKIIWFIKISQTGRKRIEKKNDKNKDCDV